MCSHPLKFRYQKLVACWVHSIRHWANNCFAKCRTENTQPRITQPKNTQPNPSEQIFTATFFVLGRKPLKEWFLKQPTTKPYSVWATFGAKNKIAFDLCSVLKFCCTVKVMYKMLVMFPWLYTCMLVLLCCTLWIVCTISVHYSSLAPHCKQVLLYCLF